MTALSSWVPTRPSLLLRIRDPGDAAAWQTFVDVYGPLVYRRCRARGLQDADAAEVMQEVLLRVSRAAARFEYRPGKGRFRDWLGAVTRNALLSFLRKRAVEAGARGRSGVADALDHAAADGQDPEWEEAFHRHVLQAALARVRPSFEGHTWRAFELTWLQDRPAAEAARELGQGLDWVYMAKSRVLKRLREEVRRLAEDTVLYGP